MIQDINDGRLKDAGLKKGFIITHIDKAPIKSKNNSLTCSSPRKVVY